MMQERASSKQACFVDPFPGALEIHAGVPRVSPTLYMPSNSGSISQPAGVYMLVRRWSDSFFVKGEMP